jgi:hypothetical protein
VKPFARAYKDLLKHLPAQTHYSSVSARIVHSAAPAGQWILLNWRFDPSASAGSRNLVDAIRQGCQRGRYWLRAYAALPDRVAVLLYPLENPATLLAELAGAMGHAHERLRMIRNDAELERAATYVESLPVRSHLAPRPEDYPWSSVGWLHEIERAGAHPVVRL